MSDEHNNTIGGDQIDARQSQGLINRPSGPITQYYYLSPATQLDRQQQRNRRAMLQKVKSIWIEGLLEQSFAKELRIALDLVEQPDAIDLPLNAIVQELRRPARELPAGTSIIQVFEQMGGALLILGAPGAGKTTLLLELARDLITRAEQDEGHPIPVVFNLSTWASKRQSLKDWLVEELNQRYDVPWKVAEAWIDTDGVLPLLDGLDEVAADRQGACVETINAYRLHDTKAMVPLAICSRVADYEALATNKLRLQGAVVVQPLTPSQVDAYLECADEKLASVRAALHDDAELGEMLRTPLMLNIVTLVYAGKTEVEVQAAGTTDERRRHLFDAYIEVMFARRGQHPVYTSQQTTFRLSWLAGKLLEHNQTVYYIERTQPDWLPPAQRRGYHIRARLFSGVLVGLGFGLAGGLLGGPLVGLGFGLAGGLSGGLGGQPSKIILVEALRWSWSRARSRVRIGLLIGLLIGLAGGLRVGLGPTRDGRPGVGLANGLLGGLLIGLGGGLSVGLFSGLLSNEIEMRTIPNQGIRRSAGSWLLVGLLIGLAGGLLFGLLFGLFGGLLVGLLVGLGSGPLFGLFGGLLGGLNYGGRTVLQHYILRWLLSRNGSLPLRLVPFLDYCAERISLRKVGGGYIFIHRLLMEHFASLYDWPSLE